MFKRRSIGLFLCFLAIIAICTLASSNAAAVVASKNTATTTKAKRTATRSSTRSLALVAVPTSIALSAAPTSVWLKTNSTLSGSLNTPDASTGSANPVANEPIQIQVSTNSTSWTVVKTVTTAANGGFTTPVAITNASAEYRAVFTGDSNYAASQSATIRVTGFVASTRLVSTGPTKVKAETLTTFSGHYEVNDSRMNSHPAISGARVDVYRRDAYGAGWTLATTAVSNTSGNIAWRAKVSTPTYWKLVGHATSTSHGSGSGEYLPHVVPIGTIYKLPAAAPKPIYLTPQPAAVGTGANPTVTAIPDRVWNDMTGKSWHAGCPVGRSQLLYMRVNYWGFDGYRHRGELVFRASQRAKYVSAFTRIYNNHVPLHGMYRVDKFGYSSVTHGGDDYASMRHDNTSAFNCRWVDGNPGTLSPHAYGTAVDINPYENPYHSAKGWTPNFWWRNHNFPPYTWRSRSALLVRAMLNAGFHWTYGNEDSQHFDT
ncbi:MAG TPA: M15 family metallopeptidase [Candidatus Microsaccharimonas sp.]|nr:M15 family metallopeptidase [Candidatus Microsaccharimonas sp.]